MSRLGDALRRAATSNSGVNALYESDRVKAEAASELDFPGLSVMDDVAAFAPDSRSVSTGTLAVAPVATGPVPVARTGVPSAKRAHGTTEVLDRQVGSPMRHRDLALERHLAPLVERVFLPLDGEGTRCVAFAATGSEARSGAVTATAAGMLAELTSGTVCVVDANFRAPSLQQYFGLPDGSGLSEALALDTPLAECAQRVQRNLWVVPAGVATDRPAFVSAAARQQMTQFMAQFDYVLVDVEPVTAASNVAGLLRLVGGVIVVVAADATRREAARRATDALAESGVSVIGAVLLNRQSAAAGASDRL